MIFALDFARKAKWVTHSRSQEKTKKRALHKNLVRRGTTKNQIEPDEDGLPELRPKIDFHFLR